MGGDLVEDRQVGFQVLVREKVPPLAAAGNGQPTSVAVGVRPAVPARVRVVEVRVIGEA